MKISKNILILPNFSIDISNKLADEGRDDQEIIKTIKNTGIKSIRISQLNSFSEFIFKGLLKIKEVYKNFFDEVDSIIVVSQSYDERIPSLSTRIQNKLGLEENIFCLDIMDGCSGYIKSFSLAQMLHSKGYKKTLIIAGDINSKMTETSDIGTKILFGDGISISILEKHKNGLETRLFNRGDNENIISCPVNRGSMLMNGFEVFRFTKKEVPKLIENFLKETNTSLEDFDLLGLHQASYLVVSTICNSIKFKNKLCKDFACEEIGNLGAGSIGAWLSQIKDLSFQGPLKMLAIGFGSGLSWGLANVIVDVDINEVMYV